MKTNRVMLAVCACLFAAAVWPSEALAQRRVVRARAARPVVVVSAGYYRPFFYSPFYYSAFYSPFYGGWWPFYAQYPPYGYPYGRGAISEARLQMKPRDAEVYVDGYYVGRVDNFDGVFQRLELPPGEHEILVYREGYRTYRYRNLFRPGEGYKVQAALEPLGSGEPQDPRPQGGSVAPDQQPPYGSSGDPRAPEPGRTMPLPERRGSARADASGFGTLAVRVQPADAIVTIDGERWDSPEGGSRLLVQLAAGRHQIEVRKDGFKPYSTSVDVRPGETQTVNVSLPPGGEL